MATLRRIVTGINDQGRSHIVSDGPPFDLGTLTEFWTTETAPASYGSDDEVAGRRVMLEQEVAAGFSAVGAEHCRPDTSRSPRMHTTSSVDYIVLLQGEVTLLLDDDEVDLKPFDVVVQRGTNHAWINKSNEPALLVGILVDALRAGGAS